MALHVADFWNLAMESQVLSPAECQHYGAVFANLKGVGRQDSATVLSEWLISENVISRFQASTLLAGGCGPFVFGDYRVYDRVDSGRLAGAFRAAHVPTGHPVMLAFLPGEVTDDANRWQHTVYTSTLLATLSNPHLRRCYELVETAVAGHSYRFLVQEELPGAALIDSLAMGQVLPPSEACRLVRQAAIGLASLHAVGIAHSRITPERLWLAEGAAVKVLFDPTLPTTAIDFAAHEAQGDLALLVDYLAPELFHAGYPPNPSTDVYALGCLLHQLLVGRPPFPGGSLAEKAARHAAEPITPLEYSGVPQPLAQLINYLLAKDPAIRVPNAAVLVDALAPFVDPAAAAQMPAAPPTTANYEQWIGEQHAYRAHQNAAIAPPAMHAPDVFSESFGHSPTPLFDMSGPSPTAPPSYAESASLTYVEPTSSMPVAARVRATGHHRPTPGPAAVIIGIVGVLVVVVGVLAVNALSGPPTAVNSDEEKQAESTDPSESSPHSPRVDPAKGDSKRPDDGKVNGNPTESGKGKPLVAEDTKPSQSPDEKPPATADGSEKPKDPPAESGPKPREETVADDGKLLWASPTTGTPLNARFVGLGAQAMLVFRPAALQATGEGQRFVASLGPAGQSLRATVEAATGVAWDAAERVQIVLYPNGDLPPRASYVVQLREPVQAADLAKKWKDAELGKFEGQNLYASETTAYYLPASGGGRLLAVGPIETMQEVVRLKDAPGSLGPLVDKMLQSTDADRHVTFVGTPQFLFGDGRKLFAGPAEQVPRLLEGFLGDGIRALAFSMHVDEVNFFAELRLLGSAEHNPEALAGRFAEAIGKLPSAIEDAQVGVQYSRYGDKTLRRFPRMISELAGNLRSGVEDGQAVLRCYLWGHAAHNLAQAVDLAIHEGSGGAASPSAVAQTPAANPNSAAERLKRPMTLTFPKNSLEQALELVSAEIGIKIVMLGNDMMAEGITKNQSINEFNEKNQPAEAILRKILLIANPQGKLVYVIKPQPGGAEIIEVTTRTAAKTRGDKLPATLESSTKDPKKPATKPVIPKKKK